jgi:hypothetical protein
MASVRHAGIARFDAIRRTRNAHEAAGFELRLAPRHIPAVVNQSSSTWNAPAVCVKDQRRRSSARLVAQRPDRCNACMIWINVPASCAG